MCATSLSMYMHMCMHMYVVVHVGTLPPRSRELKRRLHVARGPWRGQSLTATAMSWRQHHGHAHTPAPLEESPAVPKWKPGEGGAASKARAKEARKYAEQRGMMREVEREKRKEQKEEEKKQQTQAETPQDAEKPICKFFQEGTCARGARCKFRHVLQGEPVAAVAAAPAADVDTVLSQDAWLQVLSKLPIAGVCSVSRCCVSLAAIASTPSLWVELRNRTFGDEQEPSAQDASGGVGGAAPSARLECCHSESALRAYARAAHDAPTELPLSETCAIAIAGKLGVSAHASKMIRLWEVRSGRRLGCRTLKHSIVALDAATVGERANAYDPSGTRAYAVAGDSNGALHVLDLEEELDAPSQRRPFTPNVDAHAPMCSVLMLSRGGGGTAAGAATGSAAAAGGGEGDDDDDAAEGGEEDDEGDDGGGVGFHVASAYRDGTVCLATFSPTNTTTVSWHRGLTLTGDGALTFGDAPGQLPQRHDNSGPLGWARTPSLVALADGGAASGRLYTTFNGMACAVDVERGSLAWSSGRAVGDIGDLFLSGDILQAEAIEIGDAEDDPVADAAAGLAGMQMTPPRPPPTPLLIDAVGARLASYSPGWGLLAVAHRRIVTLWDERAKNGLVARFETGGDSSEKVEMDGGGVYLDNGHEGVLASSRWGGALLHLPPGPTAKVHVYDVRRLGRGPRARGRSGDGAPRGSDAWAGVATGAPPPLAATVEMTRRNRSLGFCFAVGGGSLVVGGGGAKAPCSFRWPTLPQRGTTAAEGKQAVAEEDDEEAEAEQARQARAKAKEEAAAKKKKRIVTKGGGMKMKQGGSNRTG